MTRRVRWWLKYRASRPKAFTPLDAKGTPVAGTGKLPRRKYRGAWTGEETDDTRSRRERNGLDYEQRAWEDDGGHCETTD